jgi:hypothetical protein
MRKTFHCAALIIIITFVFHCTGCAVGARLTCDLPKSTFALGEYITAVVTLTNAGDQDYKFRHLNTESGYLSLRIRNSKGELLSYHGGIGQLLDEPPDQVLPQNVLKPGEAGSAFVEITWDYANFSDHANPFSHGFQMELQPDTYVLQAVWSNSYSFCHDTLQSNTLTFRVIAPPDSELNAYNSMKEMTNGILKGKETIGEIDSLKKFLHDYPTSLYAPYAKRALAGVYGGLSRLEEEKNLIWEIITDYPESSYALDATFGNGLSEGDELELMKRIIPAVPGTFVGKYAKNRALELTKKLNGKQ